MLPRSRVHSFNPGPRTTHVCYPGKTGSPCVSFVSLLYFLCPREKKLPPTHSYGAGRPMPKHVWPTWPIRLRRFQFDLEAVVVWTHCPLQTSPNKKHQAENGHLPTLLLSHLPLGERRGLVVDLTAGPEGPQVPAFSDADRFSRRELELEAPQQQLPTAGVIDADSIFDKVRVV